MSPAAGLSVVVPVGPDREHLERLLASLDALDPRPLETVLVLDGGGPYPPSGAKERPDVRVVTTPSARGPAAARNAGARAARGAVILFLDVDVTVPPDLVGRVAALLEGDPSLTAVIGSYDDAPGAPGFVSRYRNLLHHHVHQEGRERASTFWTG